MATTKFKVSYEDGTVQEHVVKPRHLIKYEDKVGQVEKAEKVRDLFTLTHIASESPLTFDEWIETVADIENESPEIPAAEISTDGGPAEAVPTE